MYRYTIPLILLISRNPANQLRMAVYSLSHDSQGFIHTSKRWLGMGFLLPSTVSIWEFIKKGKTNIFAQTSSRAQKSPNFWAFARFMTSTRWSFHESHTVATDETTAWGGEEFHFFGDILFFGWVLVGRFVKLKQQKIQKNSLLKQTACTSRWDPAMVDFIFFGKFYKTTWPFHEKKITLKIMWTKSPFFFLKPQNGWEKKHQGTPTKGCGPGFESLASIQPFATSSWALVTNKQNISHRIHVGCIYLHLVDVYGKCR